MVWLQLLFNELGLKQSYFALFYDNCSVIFMTKHQTSHPWSKHIDIRSHYVWHMVKDDKFHVDKFATEENLADVLTKVVTWEKFDFFLASLGLSNI